MEMKRQKGESEKSSCREAAIPSVAPGCGGGQSRILRQIKTMKIADDSFF